MAGTIGHKLMSGKPTKIDLDKDTQINVRCQVDSHLLKLKIISFSSTFCFTFFELISFLQFTAFKFVPSVN